uniref:Uncharacterized protein n=1 Tax=Ciona intestinalis TaxID=7719 RepID=H2XYJ9_CIOIN
MWKLKSCFLFWCCDIAGSAGELHSESSANSK